MTLVPNTTVLLATGGNANVAVPFMAFLSTLADSPCSAPVELYVIDGGIRNVVESAALKLCRQSHTSLTLHWLVASEDALAGLPDGHLPKEAFLRLLLPQLLPWCERILWLDTDVLIAADLNQLWTMDMEAHAIAAVPEYGARKVADIISPEMNLAVDASIAGAPPFNSGVLLLNLTQWRMENIAPRCIALSIQYGATLLFADQDSLNVVLARKWLRLDHVWNVQLGALRSIPRVSPERINGHVLERQKSLLEAPGIIHFAGSKPWLSGLMNPFRSRFFAALRRSGFFSPMQYQLFYLRSTIRSLLFFLSRYYGEPAGAATVPQK